MVETRKQRNTLASASVLSLAKIGILVCLVAAGREATAGEFFVTKLWKQVVGRLRPQRQPQSTPVVDNRRAVATSVGKLIARDRQTDLGLTAGMNVDKLTRFAAAFDDLWQADSTFRSEWAPKEGRWSQICSGPYLDLKLKEIAKRAGIEIAMQVSEHGGGLNFYGTTRYKHGKGGRSLKLHGVFEAGTYTEAKQCVGTRSTKGRGTYTIGELIISPKGELLMLERDVTGGARHLLAYYSDKLASRKKPKDMQVTSPDIMDAQICYKEGEWRHRVGKVPVNTSAWWSGYTKAWKKSAPWEGGDSSTHVVVIPDPRELSE